MKQDANTYMAVTPITPTKEFIRFFWWVVGERKEETGTAKAGTAQKLAKEYNWILLP